MAVRSLSSLSPGSIIKIPETTGLVDYRVLHQNYNATQNGSGRVLIGRNSPLTVSTDPYDVQSNETPWSSGNSNAAYAYCNQTYSAKFDPDFLTKIPETSYCASTSITNATSGIVSSKFFLPSANELNVTREEGASPYYTIISDAGQSTGILSQASWILSFASNEENDYSTPIFTRTGHKNTEGNPYECGWGSIRYYRKEGYYYSAIYRLPWTTIGSLIALPMFTLEGNSWQVNDDGTLYQGPLPPSGFVNFPLIAMQQNTVQISWAESNGATSYTLQRSTNNGSSWETAYTGPNTSYTDTIGTWDTVMYQVSASNADGSSPYTQSASITVVASSTLVISGQDGELGALTGDVSFQVLSNTGNQIDLSVAINGFTFYTAQVDSGYDHKISIYDIPTGSGQIVASASVQSSAGVVNQTRTWQYIKQSLQFVDDAGMGVLEQNGENIYPLTVQEAVKTYSFWGNTLDKAMMRLSNATFYNQMPSPIYQEYNLDMSTVQVGDIIQLPVNGRMVQHTVVHIGNPNTSIYDTSCDGVWVLSNEAPVAAPMFPRETAYPSSGLGWGTAEVRATYESIKTTYASEVQTAMKTVLLPYDYNMPNTDGNTPVFNVATLSNGQSSTVFPLSAIEYGLSASSYPELATASNVLDYFANQGSRIISSGARYATRDMEKTILTSVEAGRACRVVNGNTGGFQTLSTNASVYHRPAFILPTTFSHTYYIDNQNMVHEAQEYSPVGALYDFMYNKIPFTKYASGTYQGTGTVGSGNPTSLTFSSTPSFVVINGTGGTSTSLMGVFNCKALTNSFERYTVLLIDASENATLNNIYCRIIGTTLSWYDPSSANVQLNNSDITYAWIAFLE